MRTPSSTAGRMRDEAVPPGPASHPRFDARNWPSMKRTAGSIKQLPAPAASFAPSTPTLRTAQNACYEALSLALKEGHVFAALTGPEGSGKTTVLEAVLSDRADRALRCIRISDPDKVPASLAAQIEAVAYAEAGKPENLERHIVLAIDDAHTASSELLLCLARLAAMREPGRRVPQILLVGRPELWDRLAADDYDVLVRRLAIRAALPAAEDDADPWASLEDEVAQTMSQLRADYERMPAVKTSGEAPYGHEPIYEREYNFGAAPDGQPRTEPENVGAGEVPPPSMYALFPDPPSKSSRSAARETRRRMVMPLVSLFVGLAAFAFALSFYDWPDLIGEMPWSDAKPAVPVVLPNSPQGQSFGLPMPPTSKIPFPPPPQPARPTAAAVPPPAQPTPTPALPPRPLASVPPPERPLLPSTPAEKPAAPAPLVAEIPPHLEPARPEPMRPELTRTEPTRPELSPPAPVAPPVVVTPAPVAVAPPPTSVPVPAPPPAPKPASVTAVASAPPARAPAAVEAPLSPVVLALLLRRGDEESAIGDISAARLLYERAAESGSALAARQMGRSYDPAFLPAAVANSLADLAKAKQWYQRAATLGNADAATRLKALNQGR